MDRIITPKKWTLQKRLLSLGALALLLVSAVFLLTKNAGAQLNVNPDQLNIAQVSRGAFQESIPLDGTIEPLKSIFIAVAEAGRIEERFVEEGAFVKAGTPLLRLSNPELQLQLMNREELLANERTQLVNAGFSKDKNLLQLMDQLADAEHLLQQLKRAWLQDSSLYHQGAVSMNEFQAAKENYTHQLRKHAILKEKYQRELDNSNAQIRQYAASVELKQRNLEIVRSTLDMLIVKAPSSGQLTAFKAEVGEFKNKGENLGQLDIQDGFKVRASIDEHYLPRVSMGQTAFFDFNGTQHALKVDMLFPQVKNGRFEADLSFVEDAPAAIRKGQTVQLRLQLGNKQNALQLPRSAYIQQSGGNWVYVLSADKQSAERRNIRTGRQNNDSIEILEGLSEGDYVIISSYDTFGDTPTLVLKNTN